MQHLAKIASANQNRLHSQPRRHFDDRNEWRRHRDHVDHMASRQALDQRRVLMRVRIVVMLIMLTTAGNLLLMLMTGLRVRTMAMIHRRHLRHPATIAHKAAMHPKHLPPQHRREGEQGESGMERGAHGGEDTGLRWKCPTASGRSMVDTPPPFENNRPSMNTLETDIEVSSDGRVQLLSPLPSWLRPGRSHVLLVMADDEKSRGQNKPEMPAGIEKTAHVCGGDACIVSTRIPIWTLEQSRRLGFSESELLDAFPGLQPRDLDAAWRYVAAHGSEIETAIRDNEEA